MTDLVYALKALIKEAVRESIREELAGTGVHPCGKRRKSSPCRKAKSITCSHAAI